MNSMCTKLEKNFGMEEFSLYSIESLYLYSRTKSAPQSTIDLVIMLLEKYRGTHY